MRFRFRVGVRVRWFSVGLLGPGASWPLGGALGPAILNIRFRRQPPMGFRFRVRVKVVQCWAPGPWGQLALRGCPWPSSNGYKV